MKPADVNARTGIPIKELNRLNSGVWYHGTSEEGADSLQKLGVIALYNRGNMLDFGAGFYLTDTRVCFQKHKPRKKLRKYAVRQIKPKGKQ